MNFDPNDDLIYTEHLDELTDDALDELYDTLKDENCDSPTGVSLGSYLALDLHNNTQSLFHTDSTLANSLFNRLPSDLSFGSLTGIQTLENQQQSEYFEGKEKQHPTLERQGTLDLTSYNFPNQVQDVRVPDSNSKDNIDRLKYLNIDETKSSFHEKIESLKDKQCTIIQNNSFEEAKQHEYELISFETEIQQELANLHNIVKYQILDSKTLVEIRDLISFIQIILQRIDIYRKELISYFSDDSESKMPNFVLFISSQPFPLVIFKEKPIEEAYVVSLLTGSSTHIDSVSEIKASLVTGDFVYKSKKEPLSNHTTYLDLENYKATFPDLTINISTRMNTIALQFSAIIHSVNNDYLIQSQPSYPFIIITNESQWCEAAGKLLITDAFAGEERVPWPQFANTFHSHYLKATKHKSAEIERPLYPFEISYLHNRFFRNEETVNEENANIFWQWFGPCIHTIRFKRLILNLWTQGCIFGFIEKEESIRLLTNQPVGTFLIRFSESNPGVFGIACSTGESVEHFLVRGEDIGSNKSLAEFLRDKIQFKYILKFYPEELKVRRVPKDDALGSFYSKKKNTMTDTHGYIIL